MPLSLRGTDGEGRSPEYKGISFLKWTKWMKKRNAAKDFEISWCAHENVPTGQFSQMLTNKGIFNTEKLALTIFLKFGMVKDLNLNYPLRIVG